MDHITELKTLTNIAIPSSPNDATSKEYVDNAVLKLRKDMLQVMKAILNQEMFPRSQEAFKQIQELELKLGNQEIETNKLKRKTILQLIFHKKVDL